jgi:chromosome segregation ATPase
LRAQILETEQAIARCRSETIASIEPRIQKLLAEHRAELQKQQFDHQITIRDERNRLTLEKQSLELQLGQNVSTAKEQCRRKIEKMEQTIMGRKTELQAAIDAKLQDLPARAGEAQQRILAEEEILRREWERIISEKLQKEFAERRAATVKDSKAAQQRRILEAIARLEGETRSESQELSRRIEKEKRQHQLYLGKLKRKLDDLTLELDALRAESHSDQIDRELEQLRGKVANCQCPRYQKELKDVMRQIGEVEDDLATAGRGRSVRLANDSKEFDLLKSKVFEAESKRTALKLQVSSCQAQIKAHEGEVQRRIGEMERAHKEQIAAIGERVKQTVAKKDQVIEQLKEKLAQCGLLPAKTSP